MLNWRELEADEAMHCVQRGLQGEAGFLPTGFLDTHQWIGLQDTPGLKLDGGFSKSQYRLAYSAEESSPVQFASVDPAGLPANVRTVSGLRSMLHSSMIADALVGDIYLDERFVLAVMADTDLERYGIEADYGLTAPAVSLAEERLTSASLRADAVVSAAFRVSRAEAQKALKYGFVYRDFEVVGRRTLEMSAGNRLVYRTKGSLDITDTGFNPRSGRSWLLVRRLTV